MKIIAILLVLIVSAMLWQHVRYLRARRSIVQDQQAIFHSPSSFHVVTFLKTGEGVGVIPEVGRLRREIEASGSAHMVYAGQAAFTVESSQLGPQAWDAVVLVQYPSRESYEAEAKSVRPREALAAFSETYSYGVQRNPVVNLLVPQMLLGLRLVDIVRGNWNVEELTPMPASENPEQMRLFKSRIADLLQLQPVNDEAVVIFNLMQPGNEDQRSANSSYGRKMMTRMAALAHGPVHIGKAVPLEGEARFEQVAVVYYPGVRYFAELVGSRFFQGIIGDKQLGDTLVVPTVPILSQL